MIYQESSVGKTSLIKQYAKNEFKESYSATIGAEFLSKKLLINDQEVSLQLVDTAGQERYQAIQQMFYRGADGCVIVYDLTNSDSFEAVGSWRKVFFDASGVEPKEFPLIVIGNKSDLVDKRRVSREKIARWCRENGELLHFEASAKTASNVADVFETIAKKAAEKHKGRL